MGKVDFKPLGLAGSILFFGLSALLFRICIYNLMPELINSGVHPFWSFIISYSIPLTILMVATFLALSREGNLIHWKHRLRLKRLSGKEIFWCFVLFLIGFLITGLLIPTSIYIASFPLFSPPDFFPDILNPKKALPVDGLRNFMGIPLKGTYWIIPVYFIFLTFFNILGEELWFRGYILPRQELTWGKVTWVYHGIFWCLFHTPIYPWTIIYLLPTTLTVSFVSQKFQNTWAGFIVHYLGNGILALLPIIQGVLK